MLTSMAVQLVIAMELGAGAERDSLFVAMSVPLFLNMLLVSTVGVVITPAVLSHRDPAVQRRMVLRVLLYLGLGTAALAGTLYGVRAAFVDLLAPGFNGANRALTTELLAVAVMIMPVQAAASVLGGYLVARERILLPNVALSAGNTLTLAGILCLGRALTARDVVLATLAGAVLVLVIQAVALFVRRASLDSAVEADGTPGTGFGRFYKQAMPLVLSGLVSRSMPLVERNLASSMGVGTISWLGYAGYMVYFLVNATTAPTATAYFAPMCNLWNEGRREQVGAILESNLLIVLTVALTGGGLFVVAGSEVLQALALNTKFTPADVAEFVTYGRFLMVAYVFLACGGLLSRLFYVAGASLQMAVLDCLATGFYVVAAFLLARGFTGRGLAVAVSLHSIVVTALFVRWARRQFVQRLRGEFFGRVTGVALKWSAVFAAALAGKHLSGLPEIPGTALGAAVYALGAAWLVRIVWRQSGVRWHDDRLAT